MSSSHPGFEAARKPNLLCGGMGGTWLIGKGKKRKEIKCSSDGE